MNKFSKISGQKVNDLPKLINSPEEMEMQQLKYGILKLMDNCLTVRAYGSARRNILEDTVKIAGKEVFIEALIDFMSDNSYKEQIELLESMKSETKDWQSIDNKISEVNEKVQNVRNLTVNKNQVKKIKMFLETYSQDERFETLLESYVSKLEDGKLAYSTSNLVKEMIKNRKFSIYPKRQLEQIAKQYLIRATQLGYNPNGTDTNI
jgi:predicted ATP-dependent endonuclease of OLD family